MEKLIPKAVREVWSPAFRRPRDEFRRRIQRSWNRLKRWHIGPAKAGTTNLLPLLSILLLSLALSAHAETLLLRGATVHTVAKGTLTPGDVLVRDGKIAAVAPHIDEAADRTVDLAGLHLFPG